MADYPAGLRGRFAGIKKAAVAKLRLLFQAVFRLLAL